MSYYKKNNNYFTGGYEHIYNMLEKSIDKDDKKQYDYNAKKIEKECKKSTKTLSCDSGKLLKYLIRMELVSYEAALSKAKKTKSSVNRDEYLRIVKRISADKYQIDVGYIVKFFNTIQSNLKKLADNLEKCDYLVNVDMDAIGKAMMGTLKEQNSNKELRDTQKSFVEKSDEVITDNSAIVAGTLTSVSTAAIGWTIFIAVIVGANPILGPGVLGAIAVTLAVYGCYKLYQRKKFGKTVVTKQEFVQNLYDFCLNKEGDNNKYNKQNRNSVLQALLDDLLVYLKSQDCSEVDNIFKTMNYTGNDEKCIINVNKLCVSSVDKDCPVDDKIEINSGAITSAKDLKKIKKEIKTQTKNEQKLRDKRKQLTKGILKRLEGAFDAFGKFATDPSFKPVSWDKPGAEAPESDTD